MPEEGASSLRSAAKRESDRKYYASEKGQRARQRKWWRVRGFTVAETAYMVDGIGDVEMLLMRRVVAAQLLGAS
jgi:hypothetical protein